MRFGILKEIKISSFNRIRETLGNLGLIKALLSRYLHWIFWTEEFRKLEMTDRQKRMLLVYIWYSENLHKVKEIGGNLFYRDYHYVPPPEEEKLNWKYDKEGVIERLKDNSNIVVVGTKEERRAVLRQKDEWFKPKIDEFLGTLSEDDIKVGSKLSNGFGALLSKKGFEKLIDNENVEKISWPKRGAVGLLDKSVPLVKADDVWSLGFTGDGAKVCIIDSGVDTGNSFLSGK